MFRFTLILLFLGAFPALAQTTFQEQTERLMNINGLLLDFRPVSAPIRFDKSTLELSFDFNVQPSINTRVGNKDEPLDPPSVVPKLRARYVMRNGLTLGAAFAPGIEFQDYEAEYTSFELGYRGSFGQWVYGLRASYTDGDVVGPVTEQEAMDLFVFTNQGADLSLGRSFGSLHLYGFAGFVELDTELEIEEDGVHLTATESTGYGGLGLSWHWRKFGFNFEQNFSADYLSNIIFGLSYRF